MATPALILCKTCKSRRAADEFDVKSDGSRKLTCNACRGRHLIPKCNQGSRSIARLRKDIITTLTTIADYDTLSQVNDAIMETLATLRAQDDTTSGTASGP